MSNRWYFTRDGRNRTGPLSDRELKELALAGQLVPTDMVWREGKSKWVPAREVKGLFDPPPIALTIPVVAETHMQAAPPQQQGPLLIPIPPPVPEQPRHAPVNLRLIVWACVAAFLLVSIMLGVCLVLMPGRTSKVETDGFSSDSFIPRLFDSASAEKDHLRISTLLVNLRMIARELVATVRGNTTIDWTLKESVKANLRRLVRRILNKYGYPPDKQAKAIQTVLEQAELLARDWAA